MNLSVLLLRILPLSIVAVVGKSMHPTFIEKQRLIVLHSLLIKLYVGDVVIFYEPTRRKVLVKRIAKIQEDKVFVEGDNQEKSTDSNQFGWITRENILAKVIYPKTSYNSKQ